MSSPSLVIENTLPGVTAIVNAAQVARPIKRQPTSTFFAVFYSIWGPVNVPRITTSWQDWARQFGGFDANSFGDDAAHSFFNVFPGKQQWSVRVVGPDAAKATKTVKDRGVAQVETATAVGTVTGDGNASVVVTCLGMTGSPKTIPVAVVSGDTPSIWAAKVRAALAGDAAVAAVATISGTGANIVGTKKVAAADDATFNIALATGTATGITAAANSANTTAGVAPQDTLKIDAKYPSSRVDILLKIEAGTQANTAKLTIRSLLLKRKETFDNFKLAEPVNGETHISFTTVAQKSKLVDLTNLNSDSDAPINLPAVMAETALTGGDDDFAGLTAADYIGTDDGTTKTGLQAFNDEIFGGGQVAIPGITTDTAHAALIAHGERYHRAALLDPPLGSDKQDMLDIRENYGTWYGALYWPWVLMLDFEGSGLTKFYPPSGFIAGACAQVDSTIGTHKAPANIVIPGALGVEVADNGQSQTDDNTRELLNGKDINVICPLPEQGVKIYGARVMTGDRRVQMVHQIRMLNLFYYSGKIGYRWAVFAVVDGQERLFRDLIATGKSFLKPYWEVGALYGKKAEDAFIVICDDSNNPPEELEAQRVHVQWGVKLSPTAEIIILNIDNVPLFQDLGVLNQ